MPDGPTRLRAALAGIDNPLALAYACMRHYGLAGRPDEGDYLDVAVEAMATAALSWDPDGGRSIAAWVWLNMRGRLYDEQARRRRQLAELGHEHCHSDGQWLQAQTREREYDRVELRIDLLRWVELAQLTDAQRHVVEWYALHSGTRGRTPEDRSPLVNGGKANLALALAHLRRAALTNTARDDKWTRLQAKGGGSRVIHSTGW